MTLVLRVQRVTSATPSARLVRLSLDGAAFPYRAGQSVWLGRPGGEARKPYSIAIAPAQARARGYLEFLLKTKAGGRLGGPLSGLRRGALVEACGPVGALAAPARLTAPHLFLVAGGTGIAPLRAILQHALDTGYRGRVTVVYSARTPRHFAYLDELQRLARRGRIRLVLTATRAAPRTWRGERGRLTLDRLRALLDGRRVLCFVCGPRGFVRSVADRLARAGVPRHRIRTEG